MNFFFDYIFYRIAQQTFKKRGSDGDIAVALITLMQTFILAIILMPGVKFFLTKEQWALYPKPSGWVVAGVSLVVFFFNMRKFRGMYGKYRCHWKDETPRQRLIRGVLVYIAVFSPFVIFALLGVHWK